MDALKDKKYYRHIKYDLRFWKLGDFPYMIHYLNHLWSLFSIDRFANDRTTKLETLSFKFWCLTYLSRETTTIT